MYQRNLVAVALGITLAACSSNGSKGMTVSAQAAPASTTSTAATLDAGNGITITRVRVVVAKFEVEGQAACGVTGATGPTGPTGPTGGMGMLRAGPIRTADHGSSGSDDDAEMDDGECEIEKGPFLVDLAGGDLASGVHAVAGIDVPAGTYEELKFKIKPIDATAAGSDAGLSAMAAAGASILVDGTDGTATFQFQSAITVSQKREGAIVVDPATGANVTLDFAAAGWFKAADGSKLSPTDPAAAGAIEDNIRASIRVVKDHDHDGEDDDHGDGSGHDLRAGGG